MKLRRVLLISGGGIVAACVIVVLWWHKEQVFLSWQTVAMAVIPVLFVLALWRVPKKQVASLSKAGVDVKEVFKAENDARATLAQILGGFAVLIGLYFAWKNITETAESLKLTNQNLELTNEGQITERFTKAIEQLGATDNKGKPKLELRLGGIYALERIARDSERDHWPIMEILTAYVREHAPRQTNPVAQEQPAPLATDIQAILRVISRREWRYEKSGQILDFRGTDLRGAHLAGAHLTGTDLMLSNLTQAQIDSAVGDATTKLPVGLVMPPSWKKKAAS